MLILFFILVINIVTRIIGDNSTSVTRNSVTEASGGFKNGIGLK